MIPRTRDPTRLVGSLWIEPEQGALVRAAYRMSESLDVLRDIEDVREENERSEFRWVPGLFKPWTFDATLVTVDYALWEGDVWLPLRWRAEGVVRAGVLEAPAELDRTYRFASLGTEGQEVLAQGGLAHVHSVMAERRRQLLLGGVALLLQQYAQLLQPGGAGDFRHDPASLAGWPRSRRGPRVG